MDEILHFGAMSEGRIYLVQVTPLLAMDGAVLRMNLEKHISDGLIEAENSDPDCWLLTARGRDVHREQIGQVVGKLGVRTAVEEAYGVFLVFNEPLKRCCTDWQLRSEDGQPKPNDHADAAWDAAVIGRLETIHNAVEQSLAGLAREVAHFERYPRLLSAALDRLQRGDLRAFTAPMVGSYHDVWMALHQDFLTVLDKERSAKDGY